MMWLRWSLVVDEQVVIARTDRFPSAPFGIDGPRWGQWSAEDGRSKQELPSQQVA